MDSQSLNAAVSLFVRKIYTRAIFVYTAYGSAPLSYQTALPRRLGIDLCDTRIIIHMRTRDLVHIARDERSSPPRGGGACRDVIFAV